MMEEDEHALNNAYRSIAASILSFPSEGVGEKN